jgi:hypothetical protein
MNGPCASFMSDRLTVTDRGVDGWHSWLVAEELHPSRSARARLMMLAPLFETKVLARDAEFEAGNWLEIAPSDAHKLGGNRAHKGLAYNGFDLPERRKPHGRYDRFVNNFSTGSRWFTNWQIASARYVQPDVEFNRECDVFDEISTGASWAPFTQSTFDMVFGVVDGSRIGIFCIQDED